MKIYEILKQLRLEKGLTQKQMAKELHVETNTYCQYENGKRQIGIDTFSKIINVLGIPLSIEKLLTEHLKEQKEEDYPDDAVKRYLKDIAKYPLLSNEKELILAKQIFEGDEHAKEVLAKSNLRLVVSIAKKHMNRGIPFLDLINEGNIGLLKAIDKFDYRKEYKFSTFAMLWIELFLSSAVIRITNERKEQMDKIVKMYPSPILRIKKSYKELQDELGRKPTIEELSYKTGIDEKTLEMTFKVINEPMTIQNNDEAHLLKEYSIEEALEKLTENERTLIRLKFGLDNGVTKKLDEIASFFNTTSEAIENLEKNILKKLSES